jgi:hypothetical protein
MQERCISILKQLAMISTQLTYQQEALFRIETGIHFGDQSLAYTRS